ncbi:glycine/sarcosine/betaine reductase complex component C subunit beta [Natranaerobius thermophilus]|uniref:Betaine reductase n=1 Tax=Natranaerobius thermophilus (strain ATCC BAA-1301 / DSM 18059 / JW/NM-WN-LF) TaxID=457570 RepID=B2A5X8_NATTJ|nr:glycine/sarcosine/betaine reductase complex component C subunit beta [Natranaerobius thermophilus]ACB84071.1 Betaine reductase [Natranaerobius thermophilus JW/NM-WN-LF]
MAASVVGGNSYILVHAPNTMKYHGSTQQSDRHKNPESDYLKNLPNYMRSFEDAVKYPPNQTYIGNISPDELAQIEKPWYQNLDQGDRYSDWGEIMPEDEFFGLVQISDSFDLVKLEENFVNEIKPKLEKNPVITKDHVAKLSGTNKDEIKEIVDNGNGEPLYIDDNLVGCVKSAHETDQNLNAHVMLENLMAKASGSLALLHLGNQQGVDLSQTDYVMEVSEEACGDVNQRGGGNFAKAIAEIAGCENATGSDVRTFCSAPAHAMINAAALVEAGVYEQVAIVAGGAVAKLGMNGKDHVKQEMPVLEDCLGGLALLISKNDGQNPIIRTDAIGKHNVGTGSAPQAVISSLTTTPLEKLGLTVTDIDKYSVEMQNPELTQPAGAGDVPASNYKMIGALGVKKGQLEKKDMMNFVQERGMPGFAPTQGHIPSGVPFVGHARRMLDKGEISKAMIIGKGSLFLGRLTNLFDGISFVMEPNQGDVDEEGTVSKEEIKQIVAGSLRDLADSLSENADNESDS